MVVFNYLQIYDIIFLQNLLIFLYYYVDMNTRKLKEGFKDFLKKKHQKITKSRLDLIDIIVDYKRHFEIEELVNHIQNTQKLASRATIYRTIKLLIEFGIIKEIIKQNNKTIYEFYAPGERHHDHLICTSCNKIIEFTDENIEELQEDICKSHNFLPTHHRLEIFGLCEECQKKQQHT